MNTQYTDDLGILLLRKTMLVGNIVRANNGHTYVERNNGPGTRGMALRVMKEDDMVKLFDETDFEKIEPHEDALL